MCEIRATIEKPWRVLSRPTEGNRREVKIHRLIAMRIEPSVEVLGQHWSFSIGQWFLDLRYKFIAKWECAAQMIDLCIASSVWCLCVVAAQQVMFRGCTTGDVNLLFSSLRSSQHTSIHSARISIVHTERPKKHRCTEDLDPIVCLWSVYLIHYYRRGIKANEIDHAINWKWWLAWVYYLIWIEFIKRI